MAHHRSTLLAGFTVIVVATTGTIAAGPFTVAAPTAAEAHAGSSPALASSVPAGGTQLSPCPAPEARAFDFWHGEWKVNNRYLTEAGWQDAGSADVRVYPVLGGCITIEHWEGNLGSTSILGFSARAWDENKKAWVLLLNWPQPGSSSFGTLEGTFRHGRGEFYSDRVDAQGVAVSQRFTFADISPDRFRWDQARSPVGQERWQTTWIMEYARRDPMSDPPIFVGPARDTSRCSGEAYREFDFLLGEWDATTDIPRRDGTVHHQQATMRAVPILDGCAVMDFWTTHGEEPEFQAFRIRAYDEAAGQWVQFWYDTVERVFQRFEGGFDANGTAVLLYTVGTRRDRITWTADDDEPTWSYELSFDEGATWRQHASARLHR